MEWVRLLVYQFWKVTEKQAGVTNNINNGVIIQVVQVNPKTEAAKFKSAVINFIIYTFAYTVTAEIHSCEGLCCYNITDSTYFSHSRPFDLL